MLIYCLLFYWEKRLEIAELDLTITFHHFSRCLTLISHNPNEIMRLSGFFTQKNFRNLMALY